MTYQTPEQRLQGKRVRIAHMDSPLARSHVGQIGKVVGMPGSGMVSVDLDNGTADVWCFPRNLTEVESCDKDTIGCSISGQHANCWVG